MGRLEEIQVIAFPFGKMKVVRRGVSWTIGCKPKGFGISGSDRAGKPLRPIHRRVGDRESFHRHRCGDETEEQISPLSCAKP